MKQSLEAFIPALKGIIPSGLNKKVSALEKEGVIASKVYSVDCTITKAGNKRGMCTFYHSQRPVDLLSSMFCRMYLDNTFEVSQEFYSLTNMLVVAVGFDKNDSDFVGTWRPCNCISGNSSVYVQHFTCLEDPVAECYNNKRKTIGNRAYPVQQTV